MGTAIIIYLYQCIVTYIVNDEQELEERNTKKKEKEANGERKRERETCGPIAAPSIYLLLWRK